MSTKVPQNNEDQEIDIFQISKSIGGFFDRINVYTFRSIHFFVRNWIIVLSLFIVGFGLGWYLDSNKKSFQNEVIVTPNFGSADYLYAKIDLLDAKIIAGDTVFLKEVVGISQPKKISKIEIKPISDAFKFIEDKEQNFELIKLMAEDGDINKVLVDNVTSKNYTYHAISFISNEIVDENGFIKPLLKYLNSSEYFDSVQKTGFKNLEQEIAQNDTIITQIDNVLSGFTSTVKNAAKNDKLVYYNENIQLNDILKNKQKLIADQGENRLKLLRSDKTIKEINVTLNIKNMHSINGKLKIVLPILFILMFSFIFLFKAFYRKQSQKNL
ncbi:hypothetical protein BC749_101532 [Flavobacterium araucananum]|jgi:hypothetical protein|uniref:Uncharacterized protein n=1 Tax=Flavobacterium araucananum TaxID=946678 RepID=A0A227P2L0_9FLAO|nr:hypothetical protein [Flavobacterium araucananum]OXG03456.1 hypothetical protein B0A64_17665 [Flavobacterium araucananum]PWK02466.1 hypothetical protein BC749_101532 [Flavobacterium araucananum]